MKAAWSRLRRRTTPAQCQPHAQVPVLTLDSRDQCHRHARGPAASCAESCNEGSGGRLVRELSRSNGSSRSRSPLITNEYVPALLDLGIVPIEVRRAAVRAIGGAWAVATDEPTGKLNTSDAGPRRPPQKKDASMRLTTQRIAIGRSKKCPG